MSAARHDEAANQETSLAEFDREQYDPSATHRDRHCGSYWAGDDGQQDAARPVCWSELSNPTTHFLAEAQEHERIARAHETASTAQRVAEDRACVGVAEEDRHTSPFAHARDLSNATINYDPSGDAIGMTVHFAAVPGLTTRWLRRVVGCHLAIDDMLGNDVPEREDCPLVPRGVHADVLPTATGSRVVLRADSPQVVQEIIARVHRLQAERSQPPVSDR